jgi:murein L,D-transpeptidase YcbB/YkuD
VLLGALWLLAGSTAQAQSQRPALAGARPVQAAPQVYAAPTYAPQINPYAVSLRADQIDLLQRILMDAPSHGFEPMAFSPDQAIALLRSRDTASRQAGQNQLIAQTLAYAKAVRSGRLPAANFMGDWGLRPAAYDPSAEFFNAVGQDRLGPWLDTLPPPYTGYKTLRRGLVTYRDIAAQGGWGLVSAGPELKQGSTGLRVAALEARLAVEDPTVAVDAAPIFDEALTQALMRAQKRFGLNPNGILDKRTLDALNTPVERRVDQIVANMERWRWLPQVLPADRIQVNVAAAILSVFHRDTPTLTMRAVTGRPGDETPMLSSMIHSIVLNPPWNVPSSIASKRAVAQGKGQPRLSASQRLHRHPHRRRRLAPAAEGRTQGGAGPDQVRLRQQLRRLSARHAQPLALRQLQSPGQPRLRSAAKAARPGQVAVMGGDATWTPEKIEDTIASGKTVRAQLPQQIAVFLLYWTAYVTPDGQVNFRDDPYGWDRELVQRIAASLSGSA